MSPLIRLLCSAAVGLGIACLGLVVLIFLAVVVTP